MSKEQIWRKYAPNYDMKKNKKKSWLFIEATQK
jgi:hypothetical protein